MGTVTFSTCSMFLREILFPVNCAIDFVYYSSLMNGLGRFLLSLSELNLTFTIPSLVWGLWHSIHRTLWCAAPLSEAIWAVVLVSPFHFFHCKMKWWVNFCDSIWMVTFKSLKITHLNAVTQIDTKRRFCHQNLKNTCKLEGIQIKLRQQILSQSGVDRARDGSIS